MEFAPSSRVPVGLLEISGVLGTAMFTILSLDGGGVRGFLSATVLANLEAFLNQRRGEQLPIGARFDLIAGTSTGGIQALGLAYGLPASALAAFFEAHSATVFSKRRRAGFFARIFRPAYDANILRSALETVFPAPATLVDLKTDVCITSVSLQNAKPRLYKTDYLYRNSARLTESLVDIALSTSAAPTYFAAHSSKHSSNLVDGGVCANNPAIIALVDALQFQRPSKRGTKEPTDRSEIALLSIGTGESCAMSYDYKKLASGGEWDWARSFYQVAIESQSELIHFQAKFFLKHYLRVNPALKFPMALDEHEKLPELKNIADLTRDLEHFGETYL